MSLSYPFRRSDAGRSTSKRPRQKEDCTVRALALVAEASYDLAYETLKERGRKSHGRTNFPKPRGDDSLLGLKFTWMAFPAVKGESRMAPPEFARQFPEGTYICRTAKHVYAVIEGVAYDLEPIRETRCIYGAWVVSKA